MTARKLLVEIEQTAGGVRTFILARRRAVWAAITTIPDARTWALCFGVYCVFAACALPFGLATGFLRPAWPQSKPEIILVIVLYLLVSPALLEELFFRAGLLPQRAELTPRPRLWLVASLALAAFVVSHVISGLLGNRAAHTLFTNPVFLLLATMMGAACTLVYFISRSLWPPVVLHWMTVVVWILFLGGQKQVALIDGAAG